MNTVIELLNTWGGHFIHFAWPVLWQSSALIVVLFGLDVLLRRRVRAVVVYALWMLLLVKLVLPASLSLPTGLGYWVVTPAPPFVDSTSAKSLHTTVSTQMERLKREVQSVLSPDDLAKMTSISLTTTARSSQSTASLQFPGYVLFGWLFGVTVLTIAMIFRLRMTRQLVNQAMPADLTIRSTLHKCRRQMGVRQVIDARITENIPMPVVCGLVRPVVLLPGRLLSSLAAEQLKAVLFHELAHVRRGDLWVSHLQTILQVIHFYNPMLWLANAAIRRVREQAADETVLVALADDAVFYPETLLNVTKLIPAQPRLAFGLVGIFETKSKLAERIRLMLGRPFPKSARIGFGSAFMVLTLGAVLLPMNGPAVPVESDQLLNRTFHFNRQMLVEELERRVSGGFLPKETNLNTRLRLFLQGAGAAMVTPKTVSYSDDLELVLVKATARDLDVVEQALNGLRKTRVERGKIDIAVLQKRPHRDG